MKHNRTIGFTLIELLVVVAVLGILAGGILITLNIGGVIGKANITKAKKFATGLERGLVISQVGKWSFESVVSSVTPDTSGYGNDGAVTVATLGLPSDPDCNDLGFGGCLNVEVETVDGYVEVADKDFFSPSVNDITVSVWAKVPEEASARGNGECGQDGRYIITKGENMPPPPNEWEWGIENDNNNRICFIAWQVGGGSHLACSDSVKVNDDRWHHYATVIKPNTKIIGYRDGSQVCQSTTHVGSMANGSSVVYIGRKGTTIGDYFKGFIDEASIYNEALTLSHIQHLYAQGLLRKELSLRF